MGKDQLTRKIGFDENSEPAKNYIGYKKGIFYSFIDGKGKPVYDLVEGLSASGSGNNIYTSVGEVEEPKEGDIVFTPDMYLDPVIVSENTELDPNKEYVISYAEDSPSQGEMTNVTTTGGETQVFVAFTTNKGYFKPEQLPITLTGIDSISPKGGAVLSVVEHQTYQSLEYHDGEGTERLSSEELLAKVQAYTLTEGNNSSVENPREGDIEQFADKKLNDITRYQEDQSTSLYKYDGVAIYADHIIFAYGDVQTNAMSTYNEVDIKFTSSNYITPTVKYHISYGMSTLYITDVTTNQQGSLIPEPMVQQYTQYGMTDLRSKITLPIGDGQPSFMSPYMIIVPTVPATEQSPSILNIVDITLIKKGNAKEYFDGKGEDRISASEINAALTNKQTIYTCNIDEVSNPKEGDVCVQPSSLEEVTLEYSDNVVSAGGLTQITRTYTVPSEYKNLKITNSSNSQISGNINGTFIYILSYNSASYRDISTISFYGYYTSQFDNLKFEKETLKPIMQYHNGTGVEIRDGISQKVYNSTTENINTPQEGDICILPGSGSQISPTSSTEGGGLMAQTVTYDLSNGSNKRIKIDCGDNVGVSYTVTYTDTTTTTFVDSQILSNVVSVSSTTVGGITVYLTFYEEILPVNPIKEYYNGQGVNRTLIPTPIILTTLPDAAITTIEALTAIGITTNDIKKAADGLCTGIKYSHTDPYTSLDYVTLIPVKSAYYDSGNNYRLIFEYGLNSYTCNIDVDNSTVSVTVTTT